MTDEQKPDAYQAETPWRAIGTKSSRFATVEEAIEAAKLDWNTELRPLYFQGTDGEFKKTGDRFGVIRTSDERYLGTVGGQYTILQNLEAFSVLDVAVREFGVVITGAGQFSNGRKVWMQAKLPKGVEVVDGDFVEGYFLIASSHDGSTPYSGRMTPERVSCLNSLMAALRGNPSFVTLRHTRSLSDKLDEARHLVTTLHQALVESGESMTTLARAKMSREALIRYIDRVLKVGDAASTILKRRRDTVVDLIEHGRGNEMAPSTLWAAYNAVTEYTDHVRPAEVVGIQRVKANESAAFGANARLKQRAWDVALDMAA